MTAVAHVLAVGNGLWRLKWPLDELARQGFLATCLEGSALTTAVGQVCDFVLTSSRDPTWASTETSGIAVQTLHDDGKLVILDLDDDVLSDECWPDFEAQNHCRRRMDLIEWTRPQWDAHRRVNIEIVRLVDGITVSTQALADVVNCYTNRPVVVVPNVLDVRWWRMSLANTRRRLRSPVIGWAGSCRYPEATSLVGRVWASLAYRYPEVTFATVGCTPPAFEQEAVLKGRLFRAGYVDSNSWPETLAQIDIACVAATETQWDCCKTPIKAWEFGLSGAAVVATRTLYGPEIDDGVDGLLVDGDADWLPALERLLEDEPLRRRLIGARRRRIEREHHIEQGCWQWVDAWRRIVEAPGVDIAQRSTTASQ